MYIPDFIKAIVNSSTTRRVHEVPHVPSRLVGMSPIGVDSTVVTESAFA